MGLSSVLSAVLRNLQMISVKPLAPRMDSNPIAAPALVNLTASPMPRSIPIISVAGKVRTPTIHATALSIISNGGKINGVLS